MQRFYLILLSVILSLSTTPQCGGRASCYN